MIEFYAKTSSEMSERERRNMERSRRIAAQGMVLLENDGVLPLRHTNKKLALYGSGARRTVKGGSGSGDVNCRNTVSVECGLFEAGFHITTAGWLDKYDRLCDEHMADHMVWVADILKEKGNEGLTDIIEHPYEQQDVPEITSEDIINSDTDTAVYVLARSCGESKDRRLIPGDYELSENEKQNLKIISASYEKTVVVLNVGGVIDTKILRYTPGINAILLMGQAGIAGGSALADILTGKETPSGHLTATWADDYGDYPSAYTYSYLNHNVDDEYYGEGIYVGYRYFDSFGITPAYPMGYGLSYTTFSIQAVNAAIENCHLKIAARVENTGTEFAGSAVVQVYYSSPDGKIEKPYQELAGFVKTKRLKPGEIENVEISFPISSMASYDEAAASYILEPGEYVIRMGSHSRNTHIAVILELDDAIVTEKLSNRFKPDAHFKRLSAKGAAAYQSDKDALERKDALKIELIAAGFPTKTSVEYSCEPEAYVSAAEKTVTLEMVAGKEATLEELVGQLNPEELAALCVGAARGGFGSTSMIGAASVVCPGAAGETTSMLFAPRKIPNIVLADGPAGLRLSKSFVTDAHGQIIPGLGESAMGGLECLMGMEKPARPEDAVDYYQYCTAIPVATLLAQTWDTSLLEAAGDIVGEEMEEFGISLWLAPGMNIQRNPLCGRNFEYYSEDPLISGKSAAAVTRGVQRHRGCGTTVKHYALNNQEDNRAHCNAHCYEREIREIYLKGFEIAVKEAHPWALMSSYNLLNGVHTANHYDLLTAVCRDEWKFDGIIMTDWGTTGGSLDGSAASGKKYGPSSASGCIKAGNDLIMPGSQDDVDDIVRALNTDAQPGCSITLGQLQACAARILRLIMNCRLKLREETK